MNKNPGSVPTIPLQPPLHTVAVRLIVFTGLLILLGTQAPFDFAPAHYSWREAVREFFRHPSNFFDLVSNVGVFVPFGVGWACQARRWGWGYVQAVFLAAGVSMGFSTLLETLQLFLPERMSSIIDISTNTTGGLLGGIAYWLWCLYGSRLNV